MTLFSHVMAIALTVTKSKTLIELLLPSPSENHFLARVKLALLNRTVDIMVQNGKTSLITDLLIHLIYQVKTSTNNFKGIDPILNPNSQIPKEIKVLVFQNTIDLLEQNGLHPFLCFGLLLGYVREGDFMDHDADFDFGFFYQPGLVERLNSIFLKHEFDILIYEPSPWPCRLFARHRSSGLGIDIVIFNEQKQVFQTYIRYLNHLIVRNRSKFGFKKIFFHNREIKIPHPPEVFLDENYGNWREKSPYHHPILTSALTDFSDTFLQPLLLTSILHNQYKNNSKAVEILIEKWNLARPDKIFHSSLFARHF